MGLTLVSINVMNVLRVRNDVHPEAIELYPKGLNSLGIEAQQLSPKQWDNTERKNVSPKSGQKNRARVLD